jgi:hypothetical protein
MARNRNHTNRVQEAERQRGGAQSIDKPDITRLIRL